MSENYRFYRDRIRAQRGHQVAGRLHLQWMELMQVVERCEATWALEDRIEGSL